MLTLKRQCLIGGKLIFSQMIILRLFFNMFFQFYNCFDIPNVVAAIFDLVINELKNFPSLSIKYLVEKSLYPKTGNLYVYGLNRTA
jgi:hypothetical protein